MASDLASLTGGQPLLGIFVLANDLLDTVFNRIKDGAIYFLHLCGRKRAQDPIFGGPFVLGFAYADLDAVEPVVGERP
jgi:hypothetical protein